MTVDAKNARWFSNEYEKHYKPLVQLEQQEAAEQGELKQQEAADQGELEQQEVAEQEELEQQKAAEQEELKATEQEAAGHCCPAADFDLTVEAPPCLDSAVEVAAEQAELKRREAAELKQPEATEEYTFTQDVIDMIKKRFHKGTLSSLLD